MAKEAEFIGVVAMTISHEKGTNASKLVQTDFNLMLSDNLDKSVYLDEGDRVTNEGSRVLTTTLITGLVGNIHLAHQNGWRDSAEHLRYIIDELTRGFAAVGDISHGTFDDKRIQPETFKS